jgi:hypothetical protein
MSEQIKKSIWHAPWRMLRGFGTFFGMLVSGLILLLFSVALPLYVLSGLNEVRQYQRMPYTPLIAALGDAVKVSGKVVYDGPREEMPTGPFSQQPAVAIKWEILTKNADDDWSVEQSGRDSVTFSIVDESVRSPVAVHLPAAESHFKRVYSERSGGKWRKEYHIRPGDALELLAFGSLAKRADGSAYHRLSFPHRANYAPFISNLGQGRHLKDPILKTSFGLSFGMAFWLFLSIFLCKGKVRRPAIVGLILLLTVSVYLSAVSGYMLYKDLQQTRIRLVSQNDGRRQFTQNILKPGGITWDGAWESLSLTLSTQAAPEPMRAYCLTSQALLHQEVSTFNRLLTAFPSVLVAKSGGIKALPDIPMVASEEGVRLPSAGVVRVRGNGLWALLFGGVGIFVTILLAPIAYRHLYTRRYIELLSATPPDGVTLGLSEVKGTLIPHTTEVVYSPLTQEPCIFWELHRKVHTRNGTKWLRRDSKTVPARLKGAHSSVEIDLAGATFKGGVWNERDGEAEWYCPLDQEAYVFAEAVIEKEKGDRLVLAAPQDKKRFKYLISLIGEDAVNESLAGEVIDDVGFIYGFLLTALLFLVPAAGYHQPEHFLLLAVSLPLLFIAHQVLLWINDFAILRHRALRNRANIRVAEKKRDDLLQQLEGLPALGVTNEQAMRCAHEIAFMTAAYNQAATQYNDRVGSWPLMPALELVVMPVPE